MGRWRVWRMNEESVHIYAASCQGRFADVTGVKHHLNTAAAPYSCNVMWLGPFERQHGGLNILLVRSAYV